MGAKPARRSNFLFHSDQHFDSLWRSDQHFDSLWQSDQHLNSLWQSDQNVNIAQILDNGLKFQLVQQISC